MAVHRPDIIEAASRSPSLRGCKRSPSNRSPVPSDSASRVCFTTSLAKNALLAGMLSYIGQALESSVAAVASEDPVRAAGGSARSSKSP